MKITRLDLKGFACFPKGIDIDFSVAGTNLVIGRNEAGKSTILRAVLAVIFGHKDPAAVRRNRPWEPHQSYSGTLYLELDDGSQLSIQRDFATHRCEVLQREKSGKQSKVYSGFAEPRSRSVDSRNYEQLLESLFSIRDEAVFRNTVFIAHQGIQTRLGGDLRRLLSGTSNQDYEGVLQNLRTSLSHLAGSEGAKKPGLIRQSEEEIAQIERELSEARGLLARSAEADQATQVEIERLRGIEEELSWIVTEREASQKLNGLLHREGLCARHLESSRAKKKRIEELERGIERLATRIRDDYGHFQNAPTGVGELLRARLLESEEMAAIKARIAIMESERDAKLKGKNSWEDWAACLLLAGGFGAGIATPLGLAPGLLGGAIAGLGLGIAGRFLRRGERRAEEKARQEIAMQGALLETQLRRVLDVERRLGKLLKERDPSASLKEFQELESLLEECQGLRAARKALEDSDQVAKEVSEAEAEHAEVAAAVSALVGENPELEGRSESALVAAGIMDLDRRSADLQAERELQSKKIDALRSEASDLASRMHHDISRLEDDLRSKTSKLDGSRREQAALSIAIEELDGAIKEFEDRDVFQLARETSELFSVITAGRYDRVHLGPSLNPLVSQGDGQPIHPEDLSQGTQDQLFFALRLAMARHLAKNVKLPIFLDDPFVNFDEARLAVTKEVIAKLDDHQVFLMTWDRNYERWPGKVIDLDLFHKVGKFASRDAAPEKITTTEGKKSEEREEVAEDPAKEQPATA